jgi:hypothetical protein
VCCRHLTVVPPHVLLQDDADHQRQLYASIINQLIMAYISIPVGK